MRDEIAAAVVFLTRVVKQDNDSDSVKDHMEKFSDSLTTLLRERFKNHWYEDNPYKGQAYRCIRVNQISPDPVLQKAMEESGLKQLHLPNELTVWVDPSEVTCRIGESHGPIYQTIAVKKNGQMSNLAHTVNITQMVEQHHQKRSQHLSNILQARGINARVNTSSPKGDAGVLLDGSSNSFSPGKPPHRQGVHPFRTFPPPPPPPGARYNKYSYHQHHRVSPPFDHLPHRGAGSPPFRPPHFPPGPANGHGQGNSRHWMRGPDLVKA